MSDRHAGHLRAARPGLLHAAYPAPGRDQGEDRRPAPHRGAPRRGRDGGGAGGVRTGIPPGLSGFRRRGQPVSAVSALEPVRTRRSRR